MCDNLQKVPTGDPAVFTRLGGQIVEEPAPFSRYAGRPPDRPESKALVMDLILLGKLHDGRLLHPTYSSVDHPRITPLRLDPALFNTPGANRHPLRQPRSFA